MNRNKEKSTGRQVVVCLFWLALWQLGAMAVSNELLLPSPVATVNALVGLFASTEFYMNVGWTLFRCLISMALAFCLGLLMAWLSHRNKAVRELISLPVWFFKAVPVMAIIIYVILIASADWVAIIVCFLMCFPIAYTNILSGLDSIPKELVELSQVYDLTRWQQIRYISMPAIASHIDAAIELIAGLSWKAVVTAEVLSIPKYSLGYEMINAKYYLETPTLFAYICVIVALSLLVEKVINVILKKSHSRGYSGTKMKFNGRTVAAGKAPEIRIAGLKKAYEDKAVLEDVNLTFEAAKPSVISAPSGYGKTTLARIIAGLEKADFGSISADTNMTISYLFQEDRLVPWLNVYDNMVLGMAARQTSPNNDEIAEVAKALEIEEVLYSLPEELSGGMKHRVALGRTFLSPCNVMILDEPFRGLDGDLKDRILANLWDKVTAEKTVIVITHEAEMFEEKIAEPLQMRGFYGIQ